MQLMPERDAEAGLFTLRSEEAVGSARCESASSADIALVLYTSGTTARPKRVPLTHANLWARAQQRITALELTERDRCLNMMPLYHDSGLQMAFATLASGGTVLCPPRFDPEVFFAWLDEFHPTWYSAVPTVQAAVLSRAEHSRDGLNRCGLRFIRVGTGSLAPQVLDEVERVFAAPVIQTYGMTEVGTICSHPMPPRLRKPGSVGVPAGPAVAIIDERGAHLPAGAIGEVVVRGPNVFCGYEDDPVATAAAFCDGSFRTGDLGVLDADGYLFLKGRLKDLINRGGEKVPPPEVEDRLAQHLAVAEAAAFAVAHPTLGEDVAAAVVLREGARATEQDLRQFVALRLAAFKVPSRVLVVDEIPKGPTGKVRRQDLAEHFSALLTIPFVAPGDPFEEALARIWAEELGTDHVGVHDNFFELGGDSLRATRMCARVQAVTGRGLSLATVFRFPTIAQLAKVPPQEGATNRSASSLVAIQINGSRPPLLCLHTMWGHVSDYYSLARHLGPDQPVYGLQAKGIDGTETPPTRIEDMAAQYVQDIRSCFPSGPYLLCGYSAGGLVAWEVAQQLLAQGQRVALLALLDAGLYANPALVPERVSPFPVFFQRIQGHVDALGESSSRDRLAYISRRLKARWRRRASAGVLPALAGSEAESPQSPATELIEPTAATSVTRKALVEVHRAARRAYLPRQYPGPVTVFLARELWVDVRRDPRLPGRLAAGPVEIHRVSGTHYTFMAEPRVRVTAKSLRGCIDKAIEPAPRPWSTLPFLFALRPRPSHHRLGSR